MLARRAVSEAETSSADLVAAHRPMAERLARRYSNNTGTDADLRQVADLGLFLAAQRYDPETGPFRPFAMVTIVGELKKHLRNNGWAVKVPRRLQEASITVARAIEELEQSLQASPTANEIADVTGLGVETVLHALQVRNARFAEQSNDLSQRVVDTDLDELSSRIDLHAAASRLSPEARQLVTMRFQQEMTQRQIADELGISQSQVHRRLAEVLAQLRSTLKSNDQGES